jgi:hypothetical protein
MAWRNCLRGCPRAHIEDRICNEKYSDAFKKKESRNGPVKGTAASENIASGDESEDG